MKYRFAMLLAPLLALALSGCSTVAFYTQAAIGEASILAHRRPVEDVIADPQTPESVRAKLGLTREVLDFADRTLHLPVGGSYRTYVDTGRPYVVWNVFAAPTFSVEPKPFCYPIAGCVSYRGYFAEKKAVDFAASLKAEGLDVYVGGVAAFSTLGWFDDPILNTFLTRSDDRIAALLFHELAHKAVYIPDDTRFNESFATTVERVALSRWLAARGEPDHYDAFLAREAREAEVIALITVTREKLSKVYSSDLPDADKLVAKARAIDDMRAGYDKLRSRWGDHDEFAWWMKTEINNAKLSTIADYNDWVPAFTAMLDEASGDLDTFIARVKALSEQDKATRDRALANLAAPSTPG